jgi:hypothetical protein
MLEDDILLLNKALKEERYTLYDKKKHKKYKVIYPIHYQVYRRAFVLGNDFYLVSGKSVFNHEIDKVSLMQREVNSREKWFGLTKEEIYTELFRMAGGREGYYLVNLKDRQYWYFENEGTLHQNLLEWKVGVLVPVAEFQQN